MIALAAFLGSLVGGMGGFGGSIIFFTVLTPVVGAKSVISLIALNAICADLFRVLVYCGTIA